MSVKVLFSSKIFYSLIIPALISEILLRQVFLIIYTKNFFLSSLPLFLFRHDNDEKSTIQNPGSDIDRFDRLIVYSSVYIIIRQIRLKILEFNLTRRANSRSAKIAPLVKSYLPFGISVSFHKLKILKYGEPKDQLRFFRGSDSKVVRLRSCGIESLLTLDHRDSQYILSNGFSNFGKSPHTQAAFKRLLGDGVFTSDQRSLWSWHRHLTRPHFSRERVQDLEAIETHSKRIINWFILQSKSSKFVNVQDVFSRFTLTVGTQHLFGRCVDSLNGLLKDSNHTKSSSLKRSSEFHLRKNLVSTRASSQVSSMNFAENFFKAQSWAIVHSIFPPYLRWLHPKDSATDQVLKVVDSIIQEVYQTNNIPTAKKSPLLLSETSKTNKFSDSDSLLEKRDEGGEEEEKKNLLDHLVSSGCSKEKVRHECMNILLAATDTTASLLTSCIYELGKSENFGIFLKLREEILDSVGEPSTSLGFDENDQEEDGQDEEEEDDDDEKFYYQKFDSDLSLQKIRELKFLRAVLNETLRLHPPVWSNTRHAFEDDVLPSGFFIPAGTDCRFSIRQMQRNPDIWGPDAEIFDPNRWIDDRKMLQVRDPLCFQPFSAGPRICLGQQFAYTEASVILIRLIQRFKKIELENEDVTEVPGIILRFRGEMNVRFHLQR